MVKVTRLLALLASLSAARAACRPADKEALISLFTLLGGPDWSRNSGWDPDGGADPCDVTARWHGVGCIDPCDIYRDGPDCRFGRITALTLRDNNLTGSITNWTGIGELTNLTWVDFSLNHISGSLPAEIGQVQGLEVLNLAHNSLQGGFPTTLATLNDKGVATLNEFSFENNQIEGTLPTELGMLSGIRLFDVSQNSISGSIPTELTDVSALQVLYVHSNALTGNLPEEIGKLSLLRFVNASSNNISGTLPPSFGSMPHLNELHAFENSISGSIPLQIGKLSALRSLRLQDNELDGNLTEFHTMGDLRTLVMLDLYNNHMYGEVPPSVQNLTSLQYLYLDNEHYKPLRQKYCRQRIPNNGKYSYTIVREQYQEMTSVICEDMHDTTYAFNSLQASGVYDS